MRVLVIANPTSTTQTAEVFRRVIPQLIALDGVYVEARFTHYSGHAEVIVSGLSREDYGIIVVAGGDGTVNEVINGLLGPADNMPRSYQELPAVAILPTGSANVFARALGYPADHLAAAEMVVDLIKGNLRRTISLGTWKGDEQPPRWFAVNAGFGIDADVIARVERARSRGFAASPMLYLQVSIRAWMRAQVTPPQISVMAVDTAGEVLEAADIPLMLASNTNPWTFLGPLPVVTNPRNSFDMGLGLFGLKSVRGAGGVMAMMHLVGIGHGRRLEKLLDKRTILFDDAASVELSCHGGHRFQVDGEFEGTPRTVLLTSLPEAVEVFAPKTKPLPPTMNWLGHLIHYLRDFIRVRT